MFAVVDGAPRGLDMGWKLVFLVVSAISLLSVFHPAVSFRPAFTGRRPNQSNYVGKIFRDLPYSWRRSSAADGLKKGESAAANKDMSFLTRMRKDHFGVRISRGLRSDFARLADGSLVIVCCKHELIAFVSVQGTAAGGAIPHPIMKTMPSYPR